MKAKTIFSVIIILAVSHHAYAGIQCEGCKKIFGSAAAMSRHSHGQSSGSAAPALTPEQQAMQAIMGGLLKAVLAPPPDTSAQDAIDRQLAAQKLQAEKDAQAARDAAARDAWADLQNAENAKRSNEEAERQKRGSDLLSKTGGDGAGAVLPFKWSGSEKPQLMGLGAQREPAQTEDLDAEWLKIQKQLVGQRLEEPNKWCAAITRTLKTNAPPIPWKTFGELQPGDVLLIAPDLVGKGVKLADRAVSGATSSDSSHTVLYLKEINGKKLFLENIPGEGPCIILEDEVRRRYGSRGGEVASLAQPLRTDEADRLYVAAREMTAKNREKERADNWFDTTDYGPWKKDNVVCSEADWLLLNSAGRDIPKTDDRMKLGLGIDFSPADFYNNQQYFLVTQLSMSK